MIKAIIIDDEMHCRKTLSMLLKEYCPDVQVIDQCDNGEDGAEAIKKGKPDLIFLDIEMPRMNGFEMLEQFSEIPFAVIFTTGYDQYAIKAFHFSALDYLLKPIDHEELRKAVLKVSRQVPYPYHSNWKFYYKRYIINLPLLIRSRCPLLKDCK
jgi:two-component system LytT family response regulator